MRVAIIAAMQEELDSIVAALNINLEQITEKHFVLHCGQYLTHEICLTLSGIGKVNAAMSTQYIIDKIKPDYLINVGVAGSLLPELTFGDVVIANDLVQHDVDATAFDLPLGQIPRLNVFAFPTDSKLVKKLNSMVATDYTIHVGRIVSGDCFIHHGDKAKQLAKHFNALACEMEGAAIGHVCYLNQVPFAVVRALSDMAGQDNSAVHSYNELKDMAARRAADVVHNLLPQL